MTRVSKANPQLGIPDKTAFLAFGFGVSFDLVSILHFLEFLKHNSYLLLKIHKHKPIPNYVHSPHINLLFIKRIMTSMNDWQIFGPCYCFPLPNAAVGPLSLVYTKLINSFTEHQSFIRHPLSFVLCRRHAFCTSFFLLFAFCPMPFHPAQLSLSKLR